ncbi:MAG: Holliday junction branch migration protein RuvA, partial [Bacteroidota bacterium]
MITFLHGKLVEKRPTEAIVDVNGMGYVLSIPASSFEKLPSPGQPVHILTVLHVREDAMLLFGFATAAERRIFETMLSVSGVGPKLALAALSAMSPSELRESVMMGDTALLTRIPGVGRKTAERMILELKDRMAALDDIAAAMPVTGGEDLTEARADALAALISLGFGRAAAEKALRIAVKSNPGMTSAEEMIRT